MISKDADTTKETPIEAVIHASVKAHCAILLAAASDEARRRTTYLIGHAWGRALDEAYGQDTGLAFASILFDGVLDCWAPPPLEAEGEGTAAGSGAGARSEPDRLDSPEPQSPRYGGRSWVAPM
jgi:hypothetical protein